MNKYAAFLMLTLSFPVASNVSCYQYGSVTSCTDGTTAYNYGTVTQVLPGNGQPQITMYQYGNTIEVVKPLDFVPMPVEIPVVTPLPWNKY